MSGSVLSFPWACTGFLITVSCESSEEGGRASDCAHVVHFSGSFFVCSDVWPVYTLSVGKIVSVTSQGCGRCVQGWKSVTLLPRFFGKCMMGNTK